MRMRSSCQTASMSLVQVFDMQYLGMDLVHPLNEHLRFAYDEDIRSKCAFKTYQRRRRGAKPLLWFQ